MCLGCSRGQSGKNPGAEALPSLRLALVTDLKGYLEPCGCTSNPLGGIDRMAAQIRALRKDEVPLLLLLSGDAFFDAAPLEAARVDQANRNAKTLAQILNDLGVAAVLPGDRDRAQPAEVLESLRATSEFPWLAMDQDVELLSMSAGKRSVLIIGARPGTERDAVAAAVGGGRESAELAIALVDGSRRDANRIGSIEGVDFVVHGGLDQDAPIPPRRTGDGWALHASRQGQGLTVVDIYRAGKVGPFADRSAWSREEQTAQLDRQVDELSAKIDAWEKSGEVNAADLEPQRARLAELRAERAALDSASIAPAANAFSARWVPLEKRSPTDPKVEKLMRAHDRAVNEANRVAFRNLKPPPLGPDDVAYVGSAACATCHQPAFIWWSNHRHGVAYMTLQKRNKQFNLDCVGCHVTGYGEPGGSTVTHNLDGGLVGVGCESCHGPGAEHAKNPEVDLVRYTPESTCLACHNAEHSDLFDYDAYVKSLTVPGHGLPVKLR